MKRLLWIVGGIVLIAILGVANWLNHSLSYSSESKLPLAGFYSWTDYRHFWALVSAQPLYLWQDSAFDAYKKWCHEQGKNCAVMPFEQMIADWIWMGSIQYVGSSLSKFKSTGLYEYLQNLTTLSPYWIEPYTFWELLLPIADTYRKNISSAEAIQLSYRQAVDIGEKGVFFNCDKQKIQKILQLDDRTFFETVNAKNEIWQELKNPCTEYRLPYLHAFNRFYYLKDPKKAYEYYKISAFVEDAPGAAAKMVGVVQSRLGFHQKAFNLRLDRLVSLVKALEQGWGNLELQTDQIVQAYKKLIYEVELILLQQAQEVAPEQIKKDYVALVKEGVLAKVINQKIKECLQNAKNKQLLVELAEQKDILELAKKIENLDYQNAFCVFLLRAVAEGYIDLRTGELMFPFGKEWEKRIYRRDEEFGDRFPALVG